MCHVILTIWNDQLIYITFTVNKLASLKSYIIFTVAAANSRKKWTYYFCNNYKNNIEIVCPYIIAFILYYSKLFWVYIYIYLFWVFFVMLAWCSKKPVNLHMPWAGSVRSGCFYKNRTASLGFGVVPKEQHKVCVYSSAHQRCFFTAEPSWRKSCISLG